MKTFARLFGICKERLPVCECCGGDCKLCNIAPDITDISNDLKKEVQKKDNFCTECQDVIDECICHFEDIVAKGWDDCSPQSRPDKSFRAMLKIMLSWKKYMDSLKSCGEKKIQMNEIYIAQRHNPNDALWRMTIKKLQDLGRAQTMLCSALDSPLFKNLNKHDPYWNANLQEEEEKLDDIRCQLRCLHDNLWGIVSILIGDEKI